MNNWLRPGHNIITNEWLHDRSVWSCCHKLATKILAQGSGLPNQKCTISRGITPCASTVLVPLLKKTSMAGLTLASAVSGQVAKLQSVHGVHYLRFCSDKGCRTAE